MINNMVTLSHEICNISTSNTGEEVVSYTTSSLSGSMTEAVITDAKEDTYLKEGITYLLRTKANVKVNDKVDGKLVIKELRGGYYVCQKI